jgi:phage terminase large subunit-like protein
VSANLPADLSWIEDLPPEARKALLAEATAQLAREKLSDYKPYAKQMEFHKAGAYNSERLCIAGNQLGKTIAGGAEWAMHLTGRYPSWWEGAEFKKPVTMWASGVTGEGTRDNPQRVLVGPPAIEAAWGTGMIPHDALIGWNKAMGIPNLLDNVTVRWGGGGDVQAGTSVLGFKSYEKGREKWQGPTLDGVWFDEECPLDIYTEGLTRTNRGQRGQFAIMTFTPLQGMSEVVRMFLMPKG